MNINLKEYTKEELKNLRQLVDIEISTRDEREERKYIEKIVKLLNKLYDINPTRNFLFEDNHYNYKELEFLFEERL